MTYNYFVRNTEIIDNTVEKNALDEIAEKANEIIESGKEAPVVTDKDDNELAPSGDSRDYTSATRYRMWKTEDGGIDWEDGVENPDIERYSDSKRVGEAKVSLLYTCAAAIEAKNRPENPDKYSAYAEQTLRKWFIDEETRMNPNLEYAHMMQGDETGNYFGIIEGAGFLFFLEEAEILRENDLIDDETYEGVKRWFEDYLDWLLTSEKGRKEMEMKNNHGTFYDVQVAQIADVLGRKDLVLEAIERSKERMAEHISESGEMPLESSRKDSYGYQLYNLYAYSKLALIGEKHGEDLWNYKPEGGGSLKSAFEYFYRNLPDPEEKPIDIGRVRQLYMALRSAGKAYSNEEYYDLPAKYYPNIKILDEVTRNMFSLEGTSQR